VWSATIRTARSRGWSDPQRAWVGGDERFVGFEFESRSAEEYAKG
jgi:hypothetical protein